MIASKQSQDGTAMQKTPDDEQRSCSKHVEFYDRINLLD
jgi:hypothetical protein